jgi:hypothetical protein
VAAELFAVFARCLIPGGNSSFFIVVLADRRQELVQKCFSFVARIEKIEKI